MIVAFKLYGETKAHGVTGSAPRLHSKDKHSIWTQVYTLNSDVHDIVGLTPKGRLSAFQSKKLE